MAWLLLFVAGLLEIVWAYTMKLSEGFTRPAASIVTLAAMIASFTLLSFSMRTLPLGTAYTVWTGIGAVGAFVVGIVVSVLLEYAFVGDRCFVMDPLSIAAGATGLVTVCVKVSSPRLLKPSTQLNMLAGFSRSVYFHRGRSTGR